MGHAIQHSIKFEIIDTLSGFDGIEPFHGKEINTDTFIPTRTWDTRVEAIDAAIDALQKMKKEYQNNCDHYFIPERAGLNNEYKSVSSVPPVQINKCQLCGVIE